MVPNCKEEWRQHCSGSDIVAKEGAALHCLVNRVGGAIKKAWKDGNNGTHEESACISSLKELIKVTQVVSDPTLDRALMGACQGTIDAYCKSTLEGADPATIVPCLLGHIHRERVSKVCKEHLYDI